MCACRWQHVGWQCVVCGYSGGGGTCMCTWKIGWLYIMCSHGGGGGGREVAEVAFLLTKLTSQNLIFVAVEVEEVSKLC
jgi:hypothetical protein